VKQEIFQYLLGQGLALEQIIRKYLESAQETFQSALEERGLRLSIKDLALALDEISPAGSRTALNIILELLLPFRFGLGLRIARLADDSIEVVLPLRKKNLNEKGLMHEGAIVTTAVESSQTLWQRHALVGDFNVQVLELKTHFHKEATDSLRARMELPPIEREDALNFVRSMGFVEHTSRVNFYDENEQLVAEVELKQKLTWMQTLENKASSAETN
jgi:acyl-coenzyme A thioesterase PaaI-like protein